MTNRIVLAWLAAVIILLAGYLLRPPATAPLARPSANGALLPEHERTEPKPAPLRFDERPGAEPIALVDGPEPIAAPLLQAPSHDTADRLLEELLRERRRLVRIRIAEPFHSADLPEEVR